MTMPTVRRVEQFTGLLIPKFPSMCEVCGTGLVWFPTRLGRLQFEVEHSHGGVD